MSDLTETELSNTLNNSTKKIILVGGGLVMR